MEEKFNYSYSAVTEEEKKEIERIKRQYEQKPKKESQLERLKKLDSKVKELPQILALTIGIIGTLIFGVGLTLVLEWNIPVWGVIVGVVGAIIVTLAYPSYKFHTRKLKEKYKDEIIKISNSILNEEEK